MQMEFLKDYVVAEEQRRVDEKVHTDAWNAANEAITQLRQAYDLKKSREESVKATSRACLQATEPGRTCQDLVGEAVSDAMGAAGACKKEDCMWDGPTQFLSFMQDICRCFTQGAEVLNLAELESLASYFDDEEPGMEYLVQCKVCTGPSDRQLLWKEALEIVQQFDFSGFEPCTEKISEKYVMAFTKNLKTVDGKYRHCIIIYDCTLNPHFTVALVNPWDFHDPDIPMRRQRHVAFASVTHRRIGEGSTFHTLPSDVVRTILNGV
jgi:hypothetical protein